VTGTTTRLAAACAALALLLAGAGLVLDAAGRTTRTGAAAATDSAAAATARGRSLFVARCGSCHVLRAAHTRGRAGPNLDRRYRRTKKARVRRLVRRAIVRGDGAMPAGIVTGPRVGTLATYVAGVTGRR
jgi:mono/diheme cytochrome c family protein